MRAMKPMPWRCPDDFRKMVKTQDRLTLFEEWLDSPLYSAAEKQIIKQELRCRAGFEEEAQPPRRTLQRKQHVDWRYCNPKGDPWGEEAYWRCHNCDKTFPPKHFTPNPEHYCQACLDKKGGD